MERPEIPYLARQTHAIIDEMAAHLTPDDKARLRTMSLSEPPLSFWVLMGRVPPDQTDDERCIEVWKVILRGLGSMTQTKMAAGRALAETNFPDNRMSRLLVATGTTLVGLIDEAVRWLLSKNVPGIALSDLATLGLADALDDVEARDWVRRHLALSYVRAEHAARHEEANA